MAKRPSYYEVVNFQGKKLVASPTREFVYLLLFNIPTIENHKPFYVGHANNLSTRLGNHAQVNWHYNKFDSPVKVFIVGTVESKYADKAAEELAEAFDKEKYVLANTLPKRNTVEFGIMDTETILEYASTVTSENISPIIAWGEHWHIKTASFTNSNAVKASYNNFHITQQEIHNYINSMDMVSGVRSLANKIVDAYNEKTGVASYIFQKEDKDILNRLNHIWVPERQAYHVPVHVKLARRAAETIIDLR